jgi:hypothetical protein
VTRLDPSASSGAIRVLVVHEEMTLTDRMEEALRDREEVSRTVHAALGESSGRRKGCTSSPGS